MTKIIERPEKNISSNWLTILNQRIIWIITLAVTAPVIIAVFLLNDSLQTTNLLSWSLILGSVIWGMIVGVYIQGSNRNQIETVLLEYTEVLDTVANGDLRARLVLPLEDDSRETNILRHLGQATNRTLNTLQDVVQDFSTALSELETATFEILNATGHQIQMGNEQDAVVTETTATVNEVRATVTETAERAQSVAETAQLSVDISRNGTNSVQETIEAMETIRRRVEDIADNILELSEHTQQIGEIIATVNNLADQSRMLALNASVEAARAGEEGKGFAVVAMEVRNLADQNRDATIQVREILGEIQRATNSAVMVTEEGSKGVDAGQTKVNNAGGAIMELSKAIEDAAMAAMQIAASTRQQSIGMDQLTDAMRTIKHSTTETVSSTMRVEASVNRLQEAAKRVNTILDGLNYQDE
ncbi:MAG: hypothetical protein Phog2KO_23740 [Phototrophicaceae bacterium]